MQQTSNMLKTSLCFDIRVICLTVLKVFKHSGIFENTQLGEGNFARIRKAQNGEEVKQ